ncbi:MAG: hypothetical protein AB7I18_07220 [Candidatus Berkiella sp.]
MLRTHQIIFFVVAFGFNIAPSQAMRPMSNDEVRQEIIKGALKNYEGGACPEEFVMKPESPVQISQSSGQSSQSSTQSTSKSGSTTSSGVTSWFNQGPAWSIGGAVGQSTEQSSSHSRGGQQSESKSYTDYPGTCTCPCPYSKDLKGKECGDASVYFRYPDGDPNKIPCYPVDIQDWQITEYRQYYDIPEPEQTGASPNTPKK